MLVRVSSFSRWLFYFECNALWFPREPSENQPALLMEGARKISRVILRDSDRLIVSFFFLPFFRTIKRASHGESSTAEMRKREGMLFVFAHGEI